MVILRETQNWVLTLLTFILDINNVFKKCWTKLGENCGGKVRYNGSYNGGVNKFDEKISR
jgi:hypothetical protein